MTRKEEISDVTKEQFTYVKDENLKSALRFAFIDGAKWADKNPNSKTIAEYLYKEKGYPISLNGDIPTFEETMKDVQTYYAYKNETKIEKACDGLGTADAEPNLASLWHDASEEPRCDELLLGEDTDGFSIYRWCGQEDYWETFVNETGLSRWAYIEDLLPKGGEE